MKRSLPIAAAAAGFLALGLGGFAIAQQSPPSPGPGAGPGRLGPPPGMGLRMGGGAFGILEFDANGDGRLTKAEYDNAFRTRFAEMDANKDGGVVPEEMQAYRVKQRADAEAARFKILDADGNGQISQAEFAAAREKGMGRPGHGPGRRSDRIAMRGDGPDRAGHRGRDGRGGRDGGPPGVPPLQADGARPAGPQDANRDGKVTLEEFTARTGERFAQLDLNKDNVVTIAELQTTARAR